MSAPLPAPVLVTGASTGIGRATALRLAASGNRVFAGVRKAADGERLVAEAEGDLVPVTLDVTDPVAIATARESVGEELSGLVNNAGVAIGGPLEELAIDEFRRQIEINLTGQVAVTQAMIGALRPVQGRIVNVTSIGGRVASPFMGPYVASKFGLEAITDALRMELRPWGIDVIAVEPGSIATEIWAKGDEQTRGVIAGFDDEGRERYGEAAEAIARTLARTGRRGMKPDRVARVIERALTVRRPRPRYLVGPDAYAMVLMRAALPTSLADRLYVRGMGLPSRPA